MSGIYDAIGAVLADAQNWAKSNLSPSAAYEYIKANYAKFRAIGPAIIRLQQQAKTVAVQARAKGRNDVADDMVARINTLGSLNSYAGSVNDNIDALQSQLKQAGVPGFGAVVIPIAYSAAAVALAAVMMYVFFHYNEQNNAIALQQQALGMVSTGQLTADQALALGQQAKDTAAQSQHVGLAGLFGNLGDLAIPIAVIAGVYLLLPVLTSSRKRGR